MELLNLNKTLELNLVKAGITIVPKMEVKMALDISGSMDDEIRCGWAQDTVDLLLVAAMKFDDNGKMEFGTFNTQFKQLADVTEADAGRYIRDKGIRANGGTCFADAIKDLKGGFAKKGFFGFGASKPQHPTHIALITDGDNSDKHEFEAQLHSLENTFVQIIAIGTGVNKRYIDQVVQQYKNVGVVYLPNPREVTPDAFYEKLLNDKFKAFIGA
jgi:uncharacterized protein YegL